MASRNPLTYLPGVFFGLMMFSACYLLSEQARGFHRFYDDIEKGMSVAQVEQLFRDTYPDADQDGWPVMSQNEGGYWFTLDPRSGRYNSEFIHVVFKGGVVFSKKYLPD